MLHNPQETRTYTRIENPKRVRVIRVLWLLLAIFILGIYLIGFADFYSVLRRGLPLIDQSILVARDGQIIITQPSSSLEAVGIADGDALLAINGNTAIIDELLNDLTTVDSSRLITIPADFAAVGESVELRLFSAGTEKTINLVLETPSNIMTRSYLQLGLSLNSAMIFVFGIELIYALFFLAMAGIIFLNRSDDWMALLVASALLFLGLSTGLASHHDSIVISSDYFRFVVFASGVIVYAAGYFFPEGRIAPTWSLLFVLLYLVQLPISYLIEIPKRSPELSAFISFSYIGSMIGLLITIAYRYRKLFTREQKQQSKWLILGLTAMIISLITVLSYNLLFRNGYGANSGLYFALSFPLETILSLGLPISVAFAIIQHRLWDIDIVLNRSVMVIGVGIVLGGIFAAVFLLAQSLITSFVGTGASSLAAGISAIVVGFAFNPARLQVQHIIDRNLFRLRFDLNQLKAAQMRPTQVGILSGQRINDYLFGEIIGRGGMGEVYKAYQGEKVVAIKTLRPDVISDEHAKERFLREGKISIEHPCIAGILEVGKSDELHYIVMDFIEGQTLKDYLRESKLIDPETAIQIACDVCAALEAAHEAGYVHRDIKPANIILRPKRDGETYEAVVTDFGVAKLRGSSSTELTGTGAIGTIDYMSPEQIRTAKAVDGRSDIYALGVVLYEMLTGERPFVGSLAHVLFAHLNQPPPDILKLRQDIPVSLGLAIMRAMSKDATERYDSAAKFAAALRP